MDYVLAQLHEPKKGLQGDWYVYYALRDPETGEMVPQKKRAGINRYKTVKERKRDGNILKDEINHQIRSGQLTLGINKKSPHSLIGLLEKICKDITPGLEKETKANYEHAKKKFIVYIKESYPMAEVLTASDFTSADAMNYSSWLVGKSGLSGVSHNFHIYTMKMFFNIMVEPMEAIKKNPFVKIPRKPVVKNNNIVFSSEDREKIKKYCLEKNKPLLLVFTGYMYSCGLRVKETTLLQRNQIDLDRWVILTRAGKSKNNEQLPITIPPAFRDTVKKHCEGMSMDHYMFSKKMNPGPNPMSYKNAGRIHTKMLKELKIDGKGYKFYGYKHTGVADFLRAAEKNGKRGDALMQLMKHLRHKDPKTTMIYTRSIGFSMDEDFANLQPGF